MEIRALGIGSGMPSLERYNSCVLVKTDTQSFLFDAGECCSRLLLKAGIGPDELDAVIITHLHPDHFSGIFMLLQMWYLAKRQKPLSLYLPERESEFTQILQMMYIFPSRLGFELKLRGLETITADYPRLSFYKNDHLINYKPVIMQNNLPNQLRSYSFKLSSAKGDFVYSSDLTTTDSIAPFLRGAHTVLLDAGHPPLHQIQKLQDYELKRILLTHEPKPEIREWLAKNSDNRYQIATDHTIYHI